MKFKTGEIIELNFENIKLWARKHYYIMGESRDELFEVLHCEEKNICNDSDFEKCSKLNKCDREKMIKLYSIKGEYRLCEYDLIRATEREEFLYRIYGSEALIKGGK